MFSVADAKGAGGSGVVLSVSEPLEKQLRIASANLGQSLTRIKKVTSQYHIDDILCNMEQLVTLLPTLTVQKLLKIDVLPAEVLHFAQNDYVFLLQALIDLFDHSFPLNNNRIYVEVQKFFTFDDGVFFKNMLDVCVKNLNNTSSSDLNKLNALCFLLENALKSEGFFAVVFENLCANDDFEKNIEWNDLVKIIISLPNRVSNCLQGNFPDFFKTSEYSKLLVLNILKIIEFVANVLTKHREFEQKLNYLNFSQVLSKTLVHFNENLRSESLKIFIQAISVMARQDSGKKTIIWGLIEKLERSAIEILGVMILRDLDPKTNSVTNVLGRNLLKNTNWKFVLCTKIPLLSHYDSEFLVVNLVVFLSHQSNQGVLFALFLNLLTNWADKSALNHTSVEHRFYLSKLIVLLTNSLKNIGLTDYEKSKIQNKIYSGLPIHLESSIENIRAMGMKVGEIVTNFLQTENETDLRLTFEYDTLKESKKILSVLQELYDMDLSIYFKPKTVLADDLEEVMVKLVQIQQKSVYIPPERRLRPKRTGLSEPKNEILTESLKKPNLITIIDDKDFELDSDDDLEPYDLSNDVKSTKSEPPRYLRDLRDGLLETQNEEIFTSSLENCESLIVNQLRDDDVSLGLELLQILLALEQRFYVEDFDSLVFKSCVAITCIYPAQSAEFLCKEFHAELGTYSISYRILVLDVLGEAATALSSLKTNSENLKPQKINNVELNSAQEIIRKRLELKTRYFTKHKLVKKREKVNNFADVAGFFFFPLLYGFNKNQMLNNDGDFVLLIAFIRTLGVLMCAAQNCPVAPRMAKEILHFCWFLRFHKETKVRIVVITLIAAVVLNVNKDVLIQDFIDALFEYRLWLGDLVSPNVFKGEANLECRALAASTLCIIEDVLKVSED